MLTRWRMFVGPQVKVTRRDLQKVLQYYQAELVYQAEPESRCPSCSAHPCLLELNHGVLQDSVLCN